MSGRVKSVTNILGLIDGFCRLMAVGLTRGHNCAPPPTFLSALCFRVSASYYARNNTIHFLVLHVHLWIISDFLAESSLILINFLNISIQREAGITNHFYMLQQNVSELFTPEFSLSFLLKNKTFCINCLFISAWNETCWLCFDVLFYVWQCLGETSREVAITSQELNVRLSQETTTGSTIRTKTVTTVRRPQMKISHL